MRSPRFYGLFERSADGKRWQRIDEMGLELDRARRVWQSSLITHTVYDPESPTNSRATRELRLRPIASR